MKVRMKVNQYLLMISILFSLFLLVGCSDPEEKQRAAFSEYLQNTILRVGYDLPELSESQKEKFGNYSQDYEAIYNFSKRFNENIKRSFFPMIEHLSQIKTTQDYTTIAPLLTEDLSKIFFLKNDIENLKSDVIGKINSHKYPDDLSIVMQSVIDKLVISRADPLIDHIDNLVLLTKKISQLGEFLTLNKNDISYVDGHPHFKTKSLAESYNLMIKSIADDIKTHETGIAIYNTLNQ